MVLIKVPGSILIDRIINGTNSDDVLDDFLYTSDGGYSDPGRNETVNGLGGNDTIKIHNGNDTVNGGDGDDLVYDLGTGNDVMNGDAGNDQFVVGLGNDTINGGDGEDTVYYHLSQQLVALDLQSGYAISEGIDTLTSIEHAYGSAGNDVLLGNAANNQFVGLGGNDQMDGRDGNDFLDGSGGNDSLIGASGSDTLWGGDGNDTLNGGFSNDVLWGGYGDDVMTGGNGADHFLFYSLNEFDSYDVITDFQSGLDKIDLSALDAQPDVAGRQPFTFDSTPDGSVEEFFDMLDDWNTSVSDGSPNISGDPGEVEFRHDGGYTYIYVSTADRLTDAEIRLDGTFWLTESSFIL